MANVKNFLKSILVDNIEGSELRTRALELYIELNEAVPGYINVYFETGVQRVRLDIAHYNEIVSALKQGQKINAIKILRNAIGCGLREAKESVENMNF